MTDFLIQLVARSSGSAETIRPRLPSIFEPAWPAVGSVAGPANTPETFDDLPLSERTPFETRLSAERPGSPVAESLDGQPERRLREIEPEATVRAAKPGPPSLPPEGPKSALMASLAPLFEPETPQSRPHAHVVQFDPAAQATRLDARSPATPRPATGLEGEIQDASPGAPGHSAHPQSERAAAHDRSSALGFTPLDESYLLPKPLPTNSTVLARADLVRELGSARVHASSKVDLNRPDAAEVRLAAESEPVIQVTIGRIEVRAVSTPAPATSKERSPAAVMSLDQYLRQRSQRGRE